jgi:hypothetical protein
MMILRTIFVSLLLVAAGCGDDAPSKAPNGEACEIGDDCLSNDCRQKMQSLAPVGEYILEGGMCTSVCAWLDDTEGLDDETIVRGTCEEGEQCLRYGTGGDKLCFQGCSEEVPCAREDYECTPIGLGLSTCLPPAE